VVLLARRTHVAAGHSRAAAHRATDGIGRLFGVAANHLSNERHPTPPWQVKLFAENAGNAHSTVLFCLSRQKLV
jgi:hypothetical protein